MTAHAVGVFWVLLLSVLPASAQSANYKAAVDRYASGRYAEALSMFAALPVGEIERSVEQVVSRVFDKDRRNVPPPLWVEAALLLHTHAMATGDNRASKALSDLREAVEFQHVDAAFIRCWYLFMSSRAQGINGPAVAYRGFREAPPEVLEHPEAQLAIGAMHETAWRLVAEGRLEISVSASAIAFPDHRDDTLTPNLARAERLYRDALAAAPGLHEARVRLGRVLTLRSRYDDALAVFAALPADAEAGYRYLAALFEGDARERSGDLDGAAAAYVRATGTLPRVESAALALAHLRHAQGQRTEALERTRAVTAPGVEDGTDPWLWYRLGTAWRTQGYLEAMQMRVLQIGNAGLPRR